MAPPDANRITVRDEEICSKMMEKFYLDQSRFNKFVKREKSRPRVSSLANPHNKTEQAHFKTMDNVAENRPQTQN